ncbi:MAG TPA: cation:proton antiporter, partial [Vulgatibacter sp.]
MPISLTVLITLLVAATALAIAAKRVNVPYSVALVVGGMLIAVSGMVPGLPRLEPDVVFLVCLPALLFEGGVSSDLRAIRFNAIPVGLLASLGMVLAVGATAVAFHLALALPWGPALVIATVLGGTDTVSVLYAFRRVPAPSRLSGIMEGETLFNDGVTLVFYAAIVALVAGGVEISPAQVAGGVLLTMLGGAGVGAALGMAAAFVIRRIADPLAEIMASTAVAYGAYALGDSLGVSGAIAAVAAGLTIGETVRRHLPPRSRIALHSFWDYAAFGVTTFLFLSVGLSTSPASLWSHLPEIGIGFACLVVGRATAVYLPFLLLRIARPAQAVPFRWQHVFVVGHIKGALSIAMALGLPAEVPYRAMLVDVAFGITFVSLVGQGLLLTGVIRWLGLARTDPAADAIDQEQARLIAAKAARAELDRLQQAGLVPRPAYDLLRSDYQVSIAGAERSLR